MAAIRHPLPYAFAKAQRLLLEKGDVDVARNLDAFGRLDKQVGADMVKADTGRLRSIAGGSAVRIVAPGPVERTVATWYRLDGMITADPVRVKLATARARRQTHGRHG